MLQLGLGWSPLQTGFTLIPWALGTAVAVLLAGAVLAQKLGRASLHAFLIELVPFAFVLVMIAVFFLAEPLAQKWMPRPVFGGSRYNPCPTRCSRASAALVCADT